MAPSATVSTNGTSNGKHHDLKTTIPKAKNGTKNGVDSEPHLTSADVIRLEHEHGAHNYHPLPVVFDRALGAKVWDPEGKEYIDMLSAYSAVNQGHCHPRIVAALTAQAQKLTLSSRAFYNSVFGRFAQKVTEMFGYEMVLPMNTGAEAVETALKLARKWAYVKKGVPEGKAIVLSVEGNFHGRTLGVISMSTDPSSRTDFGPFLANVGPSYLDQNNQVQSIRFGNVEDLERALELHGKNVAAFLVEPIQGEAGWNNPPPPTYSRVQALCRKHNCSSSRTRSRRGCVATGRMLACDWPRTGTPSPAPSPSLPSAVLTDEQLAPRAAALGTLFRSSVRALNSPLVKEVRGRGLLNAIEIDEEKTGEGRRGSFGLLLKSRGVLAKPTHGNCDVRFAPPLIIGECLVDLDKLDEIPGEVESEKGHVDAVTN
ncbi:ornithine-oxo-acid aminotransferase [Mycena leptocephala]|nr:ornithine-oxo-acid aminotransferase [Mycena leptocephala]